MCVGLTRYAHEAEAWCTSSNGAGLRAVATQRRDLMGLYLEAANACPSDLSRPSMDVDGQRRVLNR